ncbi:MAG: acetylornithine deacetylase [Gammaproteobacteria bacterium]|nr:acetylornithine deacetylase [Gammaproteobacteria bacterium]
MKTQLPKVVDQLRELVAIPSISSCDPRYDQSNRPIVNLLATWLEDLGFTIELMPVHSGRDKLNLIARLGNGTGGLVLAGHTDTVPYDEGVWTHDPFSLTEADSRLYGLGSCDMKGFFPLVLEAAQSFEAGALKHPLWVLATADEECNMAGARALVAGRKALGRYAVIGEPSGLKPVHMHKGVMLEAIRLHGRAGHSSDPMLGVSALEGMQAVMTALLAWRDELQAENHNPLFAVPVPTLNLGHIRGGDNPNRICANCELHIDLRPLPGMALESLRAELKQRVKRALEGWALGIEIESLFCGTPAMHTNRSSQIVRVAERLTGESAGSVAFGTEAPYFKDLGMESIILGPGDVEQAHQPDEYLPMDRLKPTVDVLAGMIGHFCMGN